MSPPENEGEKTFDFLLKVSTMRLPKT